MAETKFNDTLNQWSSITVGYPSQTGIMISLCDIPNNNTDVGRIGDKATMTSLEFNLEIHSANAAAQNAFMYARFIVFIWRDDVTPTFANIVEITSWLAGQFAPFLSPLNHDQRVKRKILIDERVCLFDEPTTLALGPIVSRTYQPVYTFKRVIPLTNLRRRLNVINFQGGGVTGVNKIWLLMYSNQIHDTIQEWFINHYSRVNFKDM